LARRPSGRFAGFSEIGVHTCLCLKLVGRSGWAQLLAATQPGTEDEVERLVELFRDRLEAALAQRDGVIEHA
jgi:hypothetical protein